MSARPLVLLPAEVHVMHEQAVPFLCAALNQSEASVRLRGRWKNIAEYVVQFLRIVTCGAEARTSMQSQYSSHRREEQREGEGEEDGALHYTSEIRVSLPMIDYRRRERNSTRIEETAILYLQRAYRGFRSRALRRRLMARLFESFRQENRLQKVHTSLTSLRLKRHYLASRIQAIMKGYLWRKMLRLLNHCALQLQCRYRVHRARHRVNEERRRRALGPPVVELLRKAVQISGVDLLLVGYRCGSNYKYVGHDFRAQLQYEGFVYQPEVEQFIETHNKAIGGPVSGPRAHKDILTPWRHKQLLEMMSRQLAITDALDVPTSEFGGVNAWTRKSLVLLKSATGRRIQDRTGQGRMLVDTKGAVPQNILNALLSKSAKVHVL